MIQPFCDRGEPNVCDSTDVPVSLRRRPQLASLVAALVVTIGVTARAETFNVPCDVAELDLVIAEVNGNGQEDFVWLAPSCVYDQARSWSFSSDGDNPVWIHGGGATIRANLSQRVLNVNAGAILHLDDVTLTLGSSSNGGAILNQGTLTLTDSTVSKSSASLGGAINNAVGSTLRLTRSTVSGGSAEIAGGIFNRGRLTLVGSTIARSFADGSDALPGEGGGIVNAGRATLFNSTVFGNGASSVGGGIRNRSNGTVVLSNSTISDNSAELNGAGIRNDGVLRIDNSLLADNPGGDCFTVDPLSITATGGNLIADGSCPTPWVLSGDPMLLGMAGGRPAFFPLLPGSPAIDAGDVSSCPGVDQRGHPRPQDGGSDGASGCDLGSYESACGLLGIELFLVLPLARRIARARVR
jgi:hypothetical protein